MLDILVMLISFANKVLMYCRLKYAEQEFNCTIWMTRFQNAYGHNDKSASTFPTGIYEGAAFGKCGEGTGQHDWGTGQKENHDEM